MKQSARVVNVETDDVRQNGERIVLLVITDRLDQDADRVALGYPHR